MTGHPVLAPQDATDGIRHRPGLAAMAIGAGSVPAGWMQRTAATIIAVSVDHYENFPVASWLCPPHMRAAVLAIYRFARVADDMADEGHASPGERSLHLRRYRVALDAAVHGQADPQAWPEVFGPLAQAIAAHRLPPMLLHGLLDAFEQDIDNPRYADRQGLLEYCSRSANPVGRLLLHLASVDAPQALAEADAVCTALQLVNFWQDASVDLPRGRNYFPLADLSRHGLPSQAPEPGHDTAASQALLRDLCDWARALMLRGEPVVHRVPGRLGWELRLVVQGGLRILEKIEAMDHRCLSRRPTLTRADWARMAWRACRMAPAPARQKATGEV